VPTRHRGPDANGQPTGKLAGEWEYDARGVKDFDDSGGPRYRGDGSCRAPRQGRLSFNWYRIAVKVPARIGDFDTRGARVEFETSVD